MNKIYYCFYSSQPEIWFYTENGLISTTPNLRRSDDLPKGVYEARTGDLYTFNKARATWVPENLDELIKRDF